MWSLHQISQRDVGTSSPHHKAKLRLFGKSSSDVRVVFYRDASAWCPYCQRVWLYLEFKKIPYRVETVPLSFYGIKPAWYTQKVPSGLVPAIDLDGKTVEGSLEIMQLLENTFNSVDHVSPPSSRIPSRRLKSHRWFRGVRASPHSLAFKLILPSHSPRRFVVRARLRCAAPRAGVADAVRARGSAACRRHIQG